MGAHCGWKCRRMILVVTVLANLSHVACLVRRESANPAHELAQAQGGSAPKESDSARKDALMDSAQSGPFALLVRHGEKVLMQRAKICYVNTAA